MSSAFILTTMLIAAAGFITGFERNIIEKAKRSNNDQQEQIYKQFFIDHHIPKASHLIFISTLDESDLEQRLQAASNDFSLKVAHVVISKLAQHGQYGFTEDYRLHGVPYDVTTVPGGLRFTSCDKDRCGWTFHSYQPVIWSAEEHAYVLTSEFFKENVWHDFSMGKFCIHEITNKKYVTDVSFIFDQKELSEKTKFVVWDTMKGRYKVL